MSDLFDGYNCKNDIYKESDLREFFDEVYVIRNGLVCIKNDPRYKHIINFSVLRFHSSDGDGNNSKFHCFWYGTGTGEPLRECRHSWFNEEGFENGYIFYLNRDLMVDAMDVLLNYFDME